MKIPSVTSILRIAVGFVTIHTTAFALNIRVINTDAHGQVTSAINNLNALGHTVSTGGTLGSYAGYDQVWDLRYTTNLTAGDITAMGSFLDSGGSMYLTGEHTGFNATRNNSLVSFIAGVGGGAVTLANVNASGAQVITASGQAVGLHNSPNAFASISFGAANTVGVANTGSGFQVTALGSLLGWDDGDIFGAPNARMLVGFDIEIFQNGQNWTQNMVTYLGAAQASVPDSGSTLALLGLALCGLTGLRRKL